MNLQFSSDNAVPSGFFLKRIGREFKRWEQDLRHEIGRPGSYLGSALRIVGTALSSFCGPAAPGCVTAAVAATEVTVSAAEGVKGGDLIRNVAISAASAYAAANINALNASETAYALNAPTRAALHGVRGGLTSLAQGGKFGPGFLAGGFGSAAGRIDVGGPAGIVVASVVGGTASVLGGGKFANGAVTFGFLSAAGEFAKYATDETDGLKRVACASAGQDCVDDERGVLRTDGTRGSDWSRNPEKNGNWLTRSGMAPEGSGQHMYDPGGPLAHTGVRHLVTDVSKIHDWMNSWNYNRSNGLYMSRGAAFDSLFQVYSFAGMPVAGLATIAGYAGSIPFEQRILYNNSRRNR